MKDLALDTDNDLLWKDGDIQWAESDYSNVVDLLDAAKGEIRQYVYLGMYVQKYRNAPINIQDVQRELRLALESDGRTAQTATATIDQEGNLDIQVNIKSA